MNEIFETEKCKKINFLMSKKNQTTSIHPILHTIS